MPVPRTTRTTRTTRTARTAHHTGPLPSIDLFSGVAGITLALDGVATPLAYCDIAAEPQANLTSNMAKGLIPSAPLSVDVNTLNRKWLASSSSTTLPMMVVAGFPCVGFSSSGLRPDGQEAEPAAEHRVCHRAAGDCVLGDSAALDDPRV